MNLEREISRLRARVSELAADADAALPSRYELRFPPPENMSLYTRLRRLAGRLLRQWGLRRTRPPEPWLVTLRHVPGDESAKPLLIWAVGADAQTLRRACRALSDLTAAMPAYAPVLVTDVADFAFFSRLGWLVEYVPALSSPGQEYSRKKQAYIAWRYRDAPAVPYSAGLLPGLSVEDLQVD